MTMKMHFKRKVSFGCAKIHFSVCFDMAHGLMQL